MDWHHCDSLSSHPPSQPQPHPSLELGLSETRAWETCTPSIFPRKGDRVRGHSSLGRFRSQPAARSYCNSRLTRSRPEKAWSMRCLSWLNSSERKRRTQGSGRERSHTARQEHKASIRRSSSGLPLSCLRPGAAAQERHEPGEAASLSEAGAEEAAALKAGCCLHPAAGARPPGKAFRVGSTAHAHHTGCVTLCESLNAHPM